MMSYETGSYGKRVLDDPTRQGNSGQGFIIPVHMDLLYLLNYVILHSIFILRRMN